MALFEYVNSDNKQGYWIYEHLVLKMEDCLDCLNIMYPSFDLVFIFDHLCGHNRSLKSRLKASITRKYFGGKQPNTIDTVILGDDGFLGPYDHILETYYNQHMWWYQALTYIKRTRTFWISDMKNAEHHHDMFTGNTKLLKLNNNDIIDHLHSSVMATKGHKSDIVSKEN